MVSLRPHLAGLTAHAVPEFLRGFAAVLVTLAWLGSPQSVRSSPALDSWIAAQTNIQTWSAEFTQTRSLKALSQPLKASGHVWFAAPNRFHWELGDPAQTIAVRDAAEMLVIYPNLKRAERYPLDGREAGPWRDALALLEAGFPRSRQELESRFKILSETRLDDIVALDLQPKPPAARRMMPRIRVEFSAVDYSLRGTELHFADGSTLRNDFKKPTLNPTLDPHLFHPKLDEGFKIVEPLKKAAF
jgi:outer membrane lipoprotein-sorting protein